MKGTVEEVTEGPSGEELDCTVRPFERTYALFLTRDHYLIFADYPA